MSEHQTNMYMNERVAQDFRTLRAVVKESGTVTNVLGWYQEIKLHFFMLAWFFMTSFAILPSQAKNERDFSLTGVFTVSKCARMSVDML